MKLKNIPVLISCGPTWVPIDDTRIISNRSSGRMGHLLSQSFAKKGAKVTLLEGPVEKRLVSSKIKVRPFRFYEELDALLKTELKKNHTIIVHAAAVSDYRLLSPRKAKILSGQQELTLRLVPTKKLINSFKRLSPKSLIVGFKLISKTDDKALKASGVKLIQQSGCDRVIANSVSDGYHGMIIAPQGRVAGQSRSRQGIVNRLIKEIEKIP